MQIDEQFRKNLIRLRVKAGLMQEELANLADISNSSLRNYERGRTTPQVPVIRRLAKVLHVDFNELIGGYPCNREIHEKLSEITSELTMYLIKQREQEDVKSQR